LNHIITISRQHGSGGKEIGELVAKKLGIPCYDNALIQIAAEQSGFSEEHFRDYDKQATNSFLYSLVRGFQYHQNATGTWSLEDKIYSTQASVINDLAKNIELYKTVKENYKTVKNNKLERFNGISEFFDG
jgi:hypothetical protein